MREFIENYPGYLFVIATLLPLAAFLLIFLAAGVRSFCRSHRDSPLGEQLFQLFGGEGGGKGAAYVALGAMVLAFACSMTGFVIHARDHEKHEVRVHKLTEEIDETREELHAKRDADAKVKADLASKLGGMQEELKALESKWAGSTEWLRVKPAGLADNDRATSLRVGFYIDGLSTLMFVMVTFISSLIFLFSMGYMSEELAPVVEDHQVHTAGGHLHRRGRYSRFFMYLSLFCFSMLNLVLADNLFQVFLSWELVGICSYLLIGFYYERQSASNAATKAFVTNRIGDAGFIVGLLILWTYVGTFNFQEIFAQVRAPLRDTHGKLELGGRIVRGDVEATQTGYETLRITGGSDSGGGEVVLMPRVIDNEFEGPKPGDTVNVADNPGPTDYGTMPYWLLVVAGLGIFLGCVGKSAQFPLHVWLPDAMEGPTPVSALIHAATMVAAGVYLVGRTYPLFAPEALLVIAYTGAITLFVAATIAIVMTDIKKVLAYSTVSQLGYMMLALGIGGWVAGLFHLNTHAFFKALLFLGSGAVIYGCHHEQDMNRMGGLYPKMKITAITMLVGVLAIAGMPLFSGWYSKDAIVAQAMGFVLVHPQHILLFLLPLLTAGITTFYMFRMWFLTFTGEPRDKHVYDHAHEAPWTMTVPLILLALCSLGVAWGWPVWDAEASAKEAHIHHAQPSSVLAEFGNVLDEGELWEGGAVKPLDQNEREKAKLNHHLAGNMALGMAGLGFTFALLLYKLRTMDADEAQESFPKLHAFLSSKWYFDELYSAIVVRPALVIAHAFRWFDLTILDGLIHRLAYGTIWLSQVDRRVDNGIVDGSVLLIGRIIYGTGARLRNVQTGYLRSYVLFLVLAAVGIFVVLSYFVTLAAAK
jgi:NADH-quinone oxidoreductase subunit L